jgi:uncharacterized protein
MKLDLLLATVGHKRFTQRENTFAYRVYYVVCPVPNEGISTPRLWSFDRWNIFSMYRKDHGARDGSSWRAWITKECSTQGMALDTEDQVLLIAHPRLFGYAFNPISYWLIYEKSSYLKAVLCEVHNTFGSTHNYFLAHRDGSPIQPHDVFTAQKHLYVSPFNTVPPGSYTFTFSVTNGTYSSVIDYFENGERVLNTHMSGVRIPLTDAAIARTLFAYPCMTFLVLFRIHWQALRLYLKGVKNTLATRPPHTAGKTTRGEEN